MADSTARKGQIQDDLERVTELDHKELLKKQKDESMYVKGYRREPKIVLNVQIWNSWSYVYIWHIIRL